MTRTGGCNCGKVRLELTGEPLRAGLCHCTTCRRATGAPFMAIAVYRPKDILIDGATVAWTETTCHQHACPACGCRMFGTGEVEEVYVMLGCLDEAPTDLVPDYELWTIRREPWLPPLPGATQYERDRIE